MAFPRLSWRPLRFEHNFKLVAGRLGKFHSVEWKACCRRSPGARLRFRRIRTLRQLGLRQARTGARLDQGVDEGIVLFEIVIGLAIGGIIFVILRVDIACLDCLNLLILAPRPSEEPFRSRSAASFRLLDEYSHDDDALTDSGYVEGAGNSAASLQADFPKRSFNVPHEWEMYPRQTMVPDQSGDPLKVCALVR